MATHQYYIAYELPNSPSGEYGQSNRFTRNFQILAQNRTDDLDTVKGLTIGLPLYLSPYGSTASRAKSYRWDRVIPGSEYWTCEVGYEELDDPDNEDPENPLADLPEIDLVMEAAEEPLLYTGERSSSGLVVGQGIVNSAGEPFNPPPTKQVFHPKLTISRNESIDTDAMTLARRYAGKVNADVFWGAAAGEARITGISAKPFQREGQDGDRTPYIKMTYTIQFADTWKLSLLDQGTFYWDINGNKIQFEANGQPTIGLLDGTGGALPTPVAPGDAIFLPPLAIYDSETFSTLQLPASFNVAKKKKDKI